MTLGRLFFLWTLYCCI